MLLLFILVILSGFRMQEAKIVHVMGGSQYGLTYKQAHSECSKIGGSLASPNDLQVARADNGYSKCSCGWLSDKTAGYVMTQSIPECGGYSGMHQCSWSDTWNAYCFFGGPIENCSRPLGLEMNEIQNRAITASSVHHSILNIHRWEPHLARLNKEGLINAWMPHHDGRNQYLEVNLGRPMAVTGIITQGVSRFFQHQYIKSFKIAHSKDGQFWEYCQDENRNVIIFGGNSDNDTHVRNMFRKAYLVQYIRVYPHDWKGHISLRLELLGCDIETHDRLDESQREG